MDFPIFHLDLLNNRVLIALVAITHVLINHGMAVGGIPLVVLLERKGLVTGDRGWTDLARRLMTVFFVVTTTMGALSGVGIWFTTTLVNPAAISSLLRVFFWTWCVEWVVFVSEVVLILIYQLSWRSWSPERARRHLRLGMGLALASWLTMTLIVAILGFMMDPGSWQTHRTLLAGMLNPLYVPQLAFRTPLAMVLAGTFGVPGVALLSRSSEQRTAAIRLVCRWLLFWAPLCLLGAWWYARRVPADMAKNLPVALLTQGLAAWSHQALQVAALAVGAILVIALWGAVSSRRLWFGFSLVPAVLCLWLVGHFERVREFIRKPFAINGYLYANGVRKEDYALFRRDGLLTHTTFLTALPPSGDAVRDRGAQVFLAACSRCHTTDGVNGLRGLLSAMYGESSVWDETAVAAYIQGLHNVRPYMPAFPGSDSERQALAHYLTSLQQDPAPLPGAQTVGIRPNPHGPIPENAKAVSVLH